MKILLIENDNLLIKSLTKNLILNRYVLDVVKDGEMGWNYGSNFDYDLIILDVTLPKLDGVSLCKKFRTEGLVTPIILLSIQDEISARVQGLDAGADDYIVKPFDQEELFARIRALLRRSSSNPLPILVWGDLLLNLSTYEVSYNGQRLNLSTMEYELLELLLRDSQHVFSTDEIIDRLWSLEQFPSEATVRSHVRRVRKKLVESGAPKDFISTVHGRGYYLKASTVEESRTSSSNANHNEFFKSTKVGSLLKISSDFETKIIEKHHSLNLMLFSSDSKLNQSLIIISERYGIRLQILPMIPKISVLALLESSSEIIVQYPDAILFHLPSELDKGAILNDPIAQSTELLEIWHVFENYYSDVPMLVISGCGGLSDRIQALQWGADFFLEAHSSPEYIIESVLDFLKRINISAKVMVLDDDQDWLYSVTTLLKPWGFKVTTLADIQQFWVVLKAVMPDALVLDINLSQVSGFEICKLLRSDPYWCQLPVLFLSTSTDPEIQRQAFKAGADDYLYKPIMGLELAHRILNRLQRRVAIE